MANRPPNVLVETAGLSREAERVRIIGAPYYDATDYQFIRFDGPHMSWLWHNGSIDQVFC